MRKVSIEKELIRWSQRVTFPEESFKEDTTVDLKKLDEVLKDSLMGFVAISAETENLVYKIGRYLVSQGVPNSDITFIDGHEITQALDADKDWERRNRIKDLIKAEANKGKRGKWILISNFTDSIEKNMALELWKGFSDPNGLNANGLIFYSGTSRSSDNLAATLVNSTHDRSSIREFPKPYYRKHTRKLAPDGY